MNFWKRFLLQSRKDKLLQSFNDYLGGYEYKGPKSLDYKENFHVSLDYELPMNATPTTKEFVSFAKEYSRQPCETKGNGSLTGMYLVSIQPCFVRVFLR